MDASLISVVNGGGGATTTASASSSSSNPSNSSTRRRNPPRISTQAAISSNAYLSMNSNNHTDVDEDQVAVAEEEVDTVSPLDNSPSSPKGLKQRISGSTAPPPARSAQLAASVNLDQTCSSPQTVYSAIHSNGQLPNRPVTRQRRSSSIKRKPSPGVTPTKVVDWEIPRKTFHSSIGFLTLFLNYIDPLTVTPLVLFLSAGLVIVFLVDLARLRFPAFAEIWEYYLGFLMRESERSKINGVVWYLIGVIFVLAVYPRDVAVVSILTLSWSDTTASTIGRLWGKHTPPLPPHFPGLPFLHFAPRKSLAGFLAATVTGILIGAGFWTSGSRGHWKVVERPLGLAMTSLVVGVGGAVVEALDLGIDDNLTLPICSGALIWLWLLTTNLLLS